MFNGYERTYFHHGDWGARLQYNHTWNGNGDKRQLYWWFDFSGYADDNSSLYGCGDQWRNSLFQCRLNVGFFSPFDNKHSYKRWRRWRRADKFTSYG